MKLFKNIGMGILVAILVLFAPVMVSAQSMDIDPDAYDFGNVVMGDSESMVVTIYNTDGGEPLDVTNVKLVVDCDSQAISCDAGFTIDTEITYPFSILDPDPGYLDVTVSFTPEEVGMHSCVLLVQALVVGSECTALQGEGVEEEPISEAMAALLAFWDYNTFTGQGPGNSAENRLRAFGNMLDAADDLIVYGEYEAACEQLNSAYGKVDGEDNPPDFIADSDEKVSLASMIMAVLEVLDCP